MHRLVLPLLLFFVTAEWPQNALGQGVPEPKQLVETPQGGGEIQVKNADISAIIKIFSSKTKRNYILDERVKGKISLYIPSKVSADESLRVLEAVLAMKGFTSVPIGDNLWKIVPSKEARQSTIPTKTESDSGTPSAAMVTRLMNLKYIQADEVQQLLTQLVSPDGLISAYGGTNSLILIDSEDNVERLVNIITSLDLPFSDRDMTIIPIQFASAEDIANKLEEILGEPSDKQNNNQNRGGEMSAMDLIRSRLREAAGNSQAAASTAQGGAAVNTARASLSVGSRSKAPKIIPDERTNALIVVADEDMTARIKALVSKLDSKFDLSGNRFYVYHCQHANATDLADVLGNLTGSGSSGGSKGSGSSLGNDLDLDSGFGGSSKTSSSSKRSSSSSRLSNQSRTPGSSRSNSQQKSTSVGGNSGQFGEDLSITADPATNSLIISASKSDYEKLRSLLQELDVKRRQVLVEALLLEVSLTGTTDLGTEFLTSGGGKDGGVLARNDQGGLTNLLSDPSKLSGFSLAAASAGSLTLPQGITLPTQAVLLSAAQRNTNVNVLSSPTILATDNQEAEIVVGQNVPFVSSISSNETNLNNTFNQVDRQDVGITLRLTPQISSGDTVTLKIFTEVSSVVSQTANSRLGPTTTVRTSDTTVITKHGQMVVIGGLMADDSNESDEGVPFLKDIPVLGSLFRSSTQTHERRNLLIFITPRVIKDQFDSRDSTIERRDSIEKMIDENDMDPKREQVLRSPAIDRVSEAKMYDGAKPSTITAPPDLTPDNTSTANSVRTDVVRRVVNVTGTGEIKLNVTDSGAAAKRFVVLKTTHAVDGLPFSTGNPLIGVEVPEGVPELFAGTNFGYKIDDTIARFSVVGRYTDRESAKEENAKLPGNWYVLSPFEAMKFGKGPWVTLDKSSRE